MTTTLTGVPLSPEAGFDEDPADSAMFLLRRRIGGFTWWGHDGYWGTTAFTCPERDVTIVAGHQRSNMPEAFERLAILGRAFAAIGRDST
jgi:hypothetical protein